MHEHIVLIPWTVRMNLPGEWNREAAIERAVDGIRQAMARGARTLVDLTTVDLDRDVMLVAEVARRTGCNIVVASGCWWQPPRYFASAPIEWLVELWTREINEGIADTGIRAGIIKLATDKDGLTAPIEKMLRAGARAHRATGMDRFGLDQMCPFEQRVDTVAQLCRLGYGDRMVLSHDANCDYGFFPGFDIRRRLPNWHFNHVFDDVLPALRSKGVTDEQIDAMLVTNPRRIFERQGSY